MKAQKLIQGLKNLKENTDKINYVFEHVSSHKYECQLISWNEQIFKEIYNGIADINDIKQQFQELFNLPSEMTGKKISLIHFSTSRRFCIKMITKQDFIKFSEMFKEYVIFKKSNQNCLIDIYRLFIIQSIDSQGIQSEQYWIVMPCLIKPPQVHICSYDVKGHCDNRVINETDYEDFNYGKDENFLKSKHLDMIKQNLSEIQRKNMITVIEVSCNFLAKLGIIDYSLFLEIYKSQQLQTSKINFPINSKQIAEGVSLQWAVIDIFQVYNTKKKIENRIKSIFYKDISSVQPQPYLKRLIDFLNKYFS